VLSPARVEVVSSRIRHIAAGVVRDDGDVIAYLALVRPAFERIKGITRRHVRRPGDAAVGAVGIE
jgi:type II secretory pathway component PulM